MKYSDNNPPIVCMQRNSTCYKRTGRMQVVGVLWHSTGANNPTIKRYVQPHETDANYDEMIALIGKNQYGNDWNHIDVQAGLNAWIGKLADGSVATVQSMPWDYMPWGCGSGWRGSCNNGWLQFEIAEGDLNDPVYFSQVYKEACELTAYLCKKFGLDPHGTVRRNGIDIPVILDHAESYQLGMGTGHGDIMHWFPKHGKSMQTVRDDVAAIMRGLVVEEDEDMDAKQFEKLFLEYRKTLQDNDAAAWSQEARDWAVNTGLISGGGIGPDGQPNYMWGDLLNREQLATILYRWAKLMGKA